MNTWIQRTAQSWKLYVSYGLFSTCGIIAAAAILAFNGTLFVPYAVLLGLLWVVFGALGVFWIAFSIRCDRCGAHPVWELMNSKDATNSWLSQVVRADRCPMCGDAAKDRPK